MSDTSLGSVPCTNIGPIVATWVNAFLISCIGRYRCQERSPLKTLAGCTWSHTDVSWLHTLNPDLTPSNSEVAPTMILKSRDRRHRQLPGTRRRRQRKIVNVGQAARVAVFELQPRNLARGTARRLRRSDRCTSQAHWSYVASVLTLQCYRRQVAF